MISFAVKLNVIIADDDEGPFADQAEISVMKRDARRLIWVIIVFILNFRTVVRI